jgi:peptide/nickel transport system permease protein
MVGSTPALRSAEAGASAQRRRRHFSPGLEAWRRFRRHRLAVASGVILIVMVLAIMLGSLVWNVAINDIDFSARLQAPSWAHPLGTDDLGQDLLARMIYGGRISLAVGFVPTFCAMMISLVLGLTAGYLGGWPDQAIMRTLDVLFAFPLVLLAIAIAGILQPGVVTEMIAIMVVLVPYIARIVRTSTLSVKAQPYVEAARAGGARELAVVLRYVLPNMISPVLVYTTTLVGLMIVVGSGLSFLGLGVQAPAADWGTMVSDGRVVLKKAPHVTVFPGLLIVLVSLAFNFVGDGLRDALDPKAIRR